MTNCPKLKIDLHRRYVAQNLQKCVQILIQFSESKSNQNWGCCGPKTIGQKKSEKMVRKKVGKGQKKLVRILTFFRMAAMFNDDSVFFLVLTEEWRITVN